MASEKSLNKKKAEVAELAEKMKEAKLILLTGYRGINVVDDTELRKELRGTESTCAVIKNNIVGRALKENGYDELGDSLEGPTAVIMNNDEYLDRFKSYLQLHENT